MPPPIPLLARTLTRSANSPALSYVPPVNMVALSRLMLR
jgi:hypothetical protein